MAVAITTGSDRGLRLVVPSEDDSQRGRPGVTVGHEVATVLTRRPGERYEVWPLPAAKWSTRLVQLAGERGLEASTVASALIERWLAAEHLANQGLGRLVAELDSSAGRARVGDELWSASSAYLRYLSLGTDRPIREIDGLALPARLSDRLRGRWPLDPDPDATDLAIAWERAATVAGLTVAEWAFAGALELLRR